jgi:hypothetical protein
MLKEGRGDRESPLPAAEAAGAVTAELSSSAQICSIGAAALPLPMSAPWSGAGTPWSACRRAPAHKPRSEPSPRDPQGEQSCGWRHTAMQKLRIVSLRFGTARQKTVLERWTNPKLVEHVLPSVRATIVSREIGGRRERPPTRNPSRYDSQRFLIAAGLSHAGRVTHTSPWLSIAARPSLCGDWEMDAGLVPAVLPTFEWQVQSHDPSHSNLEWIGQI